MIARRCFWFFRCRFIISNFSFCIACRGTQCFCDARGLTVKCKEYISSTLHYNITSTQSSLTLPSPPEVTPPAPPRSALLQPHLTPSPPPAFSPASCLHSSQTTTPPCLAHYHLDLFTQLLGSQPLPQSKSTADFAVPHHFGYGGTQFAEAT